MFSFDKLNRIGVFMATGYICAGTAIAVIGGIPLWTEYFESTFLLISTVIICTVLIAGALGIILMRYLIKKVGAKAVYEQDILVYMIGMLLMALTLNKAMFMVGLVIVSGVMPIFFYENFNRQLIPVKKGGFSVLYLAGWALGPIVCAIVIGSLSQYGLIVPRILFAHFIVLGFWVWVKRLDIHENYADAPHWLLAKKDDLKNSPAAPSEDGNNKN
ncbi:hypothetical protein [Succinatimonas hippei]|uniref:Major facilitator superfamily (MFS) profile domain-containing protein n=1 Tax=Succinatimonas hippei (strain DSM 22608 / JCM 16073 / KCTC 15190 / YIT 12066) TaxID=762983 RepID=E8LKH8_SUCHY|nr:hypothetical protein [Succinatimonas hippei]EFY06965.1 hypothetical protein HMPREF9444_01218 [Succinatimonas hippei YIT 12066]